MGRVADILAIKGSQVHSVSRQATVQDAVIKMVHFNVGSVVVLDGAAPVGLFSERDCVRRVTLERRDPRTTPVEEVMSERLERVDAGRSIPDCMAIMTQARVRHLLVMDGDRMIGLISIGNVVKFLSREQEREIDHLTRYIAGAV